MNTAAVIDHHLTNLVECAGDITEKLERIAHRLECIDRSIQRLADITYDAGKRE